MSQPKKRRSEWVVLLAVGLVLPILYVLSMGPAIYLADRQMGGQPLWWAYAVVYSPLHNVDYYELWPEFSDAFHRHYLDFFLSADSIERGIY